MLGLFCKNLHLHQIPSIMLRLLELGLDGIVFTFNIFLLLMAYSEVIVGKLECLFICFFFFFFCAFGGHLNQVAQDFTLHI